MAFCLVVLRTFSQIYRAPSLEESKQSGVALIRHSVLLSLGGAVEAWRAPLFSLDYGDGPFALFLSPFFLLLCAAPTLLSLLAGLRERSMVPATDLVLHLRGCLAVLGPAGNMHYGVGLQLSGYEL